MRPRFTLRTLAIVVTLACTYFGAWEATKKWGVTHRKELLAQAQSNGGLPAAITAPMETSPMPFVVLHMEYGYFTAKQHYYLWLFGPKIKLPFESES